MRLREGAKRRVLGEEEAVNRDQDLTKLTIAVVNRDRHQDLTKLTIAIVSAALQSKLPYLKNVPPKRSEGGDRLRDWVGDAIGFPRPAVPSITDLPKYTSEEWRAAHQPWFERDRYLEDLFADIEAFTANAIEGGICRHCEALGNKTMVDDWFCQKHGESLNLRHLYPSGWMAP